MQQQLDAPEGGRSSRPTGPHRLPSGAVAIGPWTVTHRHGRVYLQVDPNADPDLPPGPALDLAAAIHAAALAALDHVQPAGAVAP